MRFLIAIPVLVLLGCIPPSLNVQRSALRSGADMGVTVMLDSMQEKIALDSQATVERICQQVDRLLGDKSVPGISAFYLEAQLQGKVPAEVQYIVSAILAVINSGDFDAQGYLGQQNVDRIKAVLAGIRQGNREYRISDRKPPMAAKVATAPDTGTRTAGQIEEHIGLPTE